MLHQDQEDTDKIPRQGFIPRLLTSKSCPTVQCIEPVSGGPDSLQDDASKSRHFLFDDGSPDSHIKIPKTGVAVSNVLQSRLYNRPEESDVLKQANKRHTKRLKVNYF